jgi:predicted permease
MRSLRDDWVSAWRSLSRGPRYTVAAVLILGCGIAAVLTLFSAINFYFVRPLDVNRPAELVRVGIIGNMSSVPTTMPYEIFKQLRATRSAFKDASAYSAGDLVVAYPDRGVSQRRFIGVTSDNYFSFLGINPKLGRFYSERTVDTGSPDIVLSYSTWMNVFDGNPHAIGRIVRLNGQPFAIIGVAPPSFHGTERFTEVDGYIPAQTLASLVPPKMRALVHGIPGTYRVMARLAEGVTTIGAASSLSAVAAQLDPQKLSPTQTTHFVVLSELRSRPDIALAGMVAQVAGGLTGLLVLLFGISCLSVINLTILRFIDRQGELSLRGALGATRTRLAVSCGIEGVLVGVGSFLVGLVLAQPVAAWLSTQHFGADTQSQAALVRLDLTPFVFGATAIVAIGAGAMTCIIAALRVRKLDPADALREGAASITAGRSGTTVRRLLIGAQVSVSLVLVASAWLLHVAARSWANADVGFRADGVAVLSVDLFNHGYDRDSGQRLLAEWLRDTRSASGVTTAALTQHVPLSPNPVFTSVRVSSQDQKIPALRDIVSSDYFSLMRIPLLAGRAFMTSDDGRRPRVAILNQTLAKQLFGSENAAGRRIYIGSTDTLDAEIIGVARDAKYLFANEKPTRVIYLSNAQLYSAEMSMLVRGSSPPAELAALARTALRRIDGNVDPFDEGGLTAVVRSSPAYTVMHVAAAFAQIVAAIALIQVLSGLYALLAFDVMRRRRELGLRLALGATPARLLGAVTRGSVMLAIAGIGLALLPAVSLLTRLQLLVQVPSRAVANSALIAASSVLVGCVTAAVLAGRRVLRVDPAEALRL